MRKPAKVVLTTTLGAALLLGGSTYALWNANVAPATSATIQTSGSDLSTLNEGVWIDMVRTAAVPEGPAVVIEDINDFRVVPGDRITFEQNFKVSAASGDSQTKFSVAFPNEATIGVEALRERGITLSVQIANGDTGDILASSAVAGNTLATEYTLAGDAGENIEVRFTFDFASTVTADDTKKLQVVVDNAVVTANQVD